MLQRFERFSSSVFRIWRSIQRIERDEMEAHGLKGSAAQYLAAMIQRPEGVTAAELCELCDKDKAAVSRALAQLEQHRLIRRERLGESVYRARLFLTEAGRQTAEHVCRRATLAVELAGADLDGRERAILYAALGRIADRLDRISRVGLPLETQQGETTW